MVMCSPDHKIAFGQKPEVLSKPIISSQSPRLVLVVLNGSQIQSPTSLPLS